MLRVLGDIITEHFSAGMKIFKSTEQKLLKCLTKSLQECGNFIFVLVPSYWLRLFGRLLMVPIVSGISFEIIQWAGRTDSKFALMMSKPGMAMQKFTTTEPTADMAEVAIKAVEAVFDWRAYLKEEFNLDIPYENEENAGGNQSQENDGEGNLSQAGAAK